MALLFSSYRLDQYSDPDGFKLNLGVVLEQYPIETIVFVTDPRTGIQRRCKWPPAVAEVVAACDEHVAHAQKLARYEKWGNRGSDEMQIEGPPVEKPTDAAMLKKFGPNYGMNRSMPSDAQLKAFTSTLPIGSVWSDKERIEAWRASTSQDDRQ